MNGIEDLTNKVIIAILALFGISGLIAGALTGTWHNIVIGICMGALAFVIYNEDYRKEGKA